MRYRRVISVMLAAVMLAACGASPESGEASREDLGEGRERLSLSEMKTTAAEESRRITESSYDNITVTPGLSFTVPDKLGQYQVKPAKNFGADTWEAFLQEFIPAGDYDPSKTAEYSEPYHTKVYSDTEKHYFFCLASPGICNADYLDDRAFGKVFASDRNDSCVLHEPVKSVGNKPFKLEKGTLDLSEYAEKCRSFAERFIRVTGFPNGLEPGAVYVYDGGDGTYSCDLHLRNSIEGVPIFDVIPVSLAEEMSFTPAKTFGAHCACVYEGEVECFQLDQGFEICKTDAEYTELISPSHALELLSEKLSAYVNYELIDMELCYMPVCLNPLGEDETPPEDYEAIYQLTPYWSFCFDLTPGNEKFGFVNCQTGEADMFVSRRD